MVWFYPRAQKNTIAYAPTLSIPLWSDFISAPDVDVVPSPPFNPTMVWFYLFTCTSLTIIVAGSFNPTMVWFYLTALVYYVVVKRELSIPLWSDFILLSTTFQTRKDELTFNPTMVWFYPHPLLLYVFHRFRDFQSHYGLILSWRWRNNNNSSIQCFQSHYGLILSRNEEGSSCDYSYTFNPTMVWFYR